MHPTFWVTVLFVCMLSSGLTSCASALYLNQSRGSQRKFTEAKTLGAQSSAPYEYFSAQARIEEAKRLAAQAEYDLGIEWLKEADRFSNVAIEKATPAPAPAERQ